MYSEAVFVGPAPADAHMQSSLLLTSPASGSKQAASINRRAEGASRAHKNQHAEAGADYFEDRQADLAEPHLMASACPHAEALRQTAEPANRLSSGEQSTSMASARAETGKTWQPAQPATAPAR